MSNIMLVNIYRNNEANQITVNPQNYYQDIEDGLYKLYNILGKTTDWKGQLALYNMVEFEAENHRRVIVTTPDLFNITLIDMPCYTVYYGDNNAEENADKVGEDFNLAMNKYKDYLRKYRHIKIIDDMNKVIVEI